MRFLLLLYEKVRKMVSPFNGKQEVTPVFEQLGGLMDLVKKVQQNIDEVQQQLKNEVIDVSSGDVMKIIVNGQQEIVMIELNPKYLTGENAGLIQDLLVATLNNALTKSRQANQTAMAKIAQDMNLPKIPGLF